jgi:hypothetical protein
LDAKHGSDALRNEQGVVERSEFHQPHAIGVIVK